MQGLQAASRAELVQAARALAAIYIDADRDGIVNLGSEMDSACWVLKGFFGNIFPNFDKRWLAARATLYLNSKVLTKQGVDTRTFSKIVSMMLSEEDINNIPSKTMSILAE